MDKITYGIRNVHYASKTEDANGAPIFGTVKPWRGADEISLPPVGEPVTVYADDVVYFKLPVNQGYEGNLNVRRVPEDFKINHMGEYKDINGVMIEKSGTPQYNFALLGEFQIAGDEAADNYGKRFALYDCNASRADLSGATKEDTVDPALFSIPITCSPTASDGIVKASLNKPDNESLYNSWFDSIYYNPTGLALFTVTVTVSDIDGVVPGAVVVIGGKVGVTNESGITRIALANGTYDVIVSTVGYEGKIDNVTVESASVSKSITVVAE